VGRPPRLPGTGPQGAAARDPGRARAVRDGLGIWICQGAKSLHDLAGDKLGAPVHQVLQLTAEYSAGGLFAPATASYLNAVFAAGTQDVPAGVVLFCPKQGGGVTQVSSPGGQTLGALARAHDTQCSSVVRATAENSPGGTFADDLAAHLDLVFGTSPAHIARGIRLFYRKQ